MTFPQREKDILTQVNDGLKTILLMGPGLVVLVALGLAIAGAFFFPFLGAAAWNPLLDLVEPQLLAQHIAITYTIATLLLALTALKHQRTTRWRSSKLPDFLILKGQQLWVEAPRRLASEHLVQITYKPATPSPDPEDSETEQFLICSTGLCSVRRGLQ